MAVIWSEQAQQERLEVLERARAFAIKHEDPQIFIVALVRDDAMEAEGERLDGIATFRRGPVLGTFLYVTRDGRFVLHYRREGSVVTILRVLPSRSAWQDDA